MRIVIIIWSIMLSTTLFFSCKPTPHTLKSTNPFAKNSEGNPVAISKLGFYTTKIGPRSPTPDKELYSDDMKAFPAIAQLPATEKEDFRKLEGSEFSFFLSFAANTPTPALNRHFVKFVLLGDSEIFSSNKETAIDQIKMAMANKSNAVDVKLNDYLYTLLDLNPFRSTITAAREDVKQGIRSGELFVSLNGQTVFPVNAGQKHPPRIDNINIRSFDKNWLIDQALQMREKYNGNVYLLAVVYDVEGLWEDANIVGISLIRILEDDRRSICYQYGIEGTMTYTYPLFGIQLTLTKSPITAQESSCSGFLSFKNGERIEIKPQAHCYQLHDFKYCLAGPTLQKSNPTNNLRLLISRVANHLATSTETEQLSIILQPQ